MTSAYDRDLSSASALGTSAVTLDEKLGVSPANLDWEVFAQSRDGAALIMAVPDSVSFDDLGDRLESLGFARPDEEDGTWTGGVDVVARIGSLTPQLQYWTLLEDDGLVVTSDTAGYARGGHGRGGGATASGWTAWTTWSTPRVSPRRRWS